jgi:hypothetical protein
MMRALCLAALLAGTPAAAAPSPPPSEELARGHRLVEAGDLYGAARAFAAAGPAGDLMLGATLASLGMHVSAAGVYRRLADRRADLAGLAPLALRTVVAAPHPSTRAALHAFDAADAARLRAADDREMFLYQLGRSPSAAAEPALVAVSDRTPLHGDAQLELAERRMQRGDTAGALAAAVDATRTHHAQVDAVRLLATWARSHDGARAALTRLADESSALAQFEHGRLAVEDARLLPGLEGVSVLGAEAMVFGAACSSGSDDLAASLAPVLPELLQTLDAILAATDDEVLVDELTRRRATVTTQIMSIVLDRTEVRELGRLQSAIGVEVAAHAAAPVAWRESRLGVQLRADVERGVRDGRRSLGGLARRLLVELRADAAALTVALAGRTGPVALHRHGLGRGPLGLSLRACHLVSRARPDPTPVRPQPWRCGTGCAGCASSSGAGPALIALAWLLVRFRARGALSRLRL